MLPKLSSFRKNKILLLTHSGADIDALASAAGLFFSLKKNNSVTIGIPGHISMHAKAFAQNTKLPYSLNPEIEKFDTVFFLDFNEWEMLENMEKEARSFKGKKFLIDHHAKNPQRLAPEKNSLVDPERIATSELVFEWIKKSRFPVTRQIASCIAAGIIEDSAHFLVADSRTFSIMSECLEKTDKTYQELFLLFHTQRIPSRRIALLKAAQRAEIFEAGEFVIVSSHVGAFEGEAATALVRAGADIAFVGYLEKGEIKISARANKYAAEKTGIDLAKNVMQKLPDFFEGTGGGHASAAGFNGKADSIEAPLQKCIDLTTDFLKAKNPALEIKKY
ncbi:MAG: DHH family phosphoesterase [Candidatus ainarchaeum sp.]|nr:DHH family phosphoesterase [Candidatus ainarchaeum sp.]